jgi:hypothetical protein
MIFRLVSFTGYAESVSGSAKSEALAISLESRETLFREGRMDKPGNSAHVGRSREVTRYRLLGGNIS